MHDNQGHDPDRLIPAWSEEARRDFRRKPVTFAHRLRETGLFEDGPLAALLDSTPPEYFDINLFDFDAEGQMTMRTGVRGAMSGAEVLEGVKQGRVWVQLRRAEIHYPALGEAMRAAFAGMSRQQPSFHPVQLNAQLIMSAPQAKVPFHADAPGVTLFHLRGRKRIWIYPADEAHMPQAGMEGIVLKQQTEDLPYNRGMDAAAQVFDLEPGLAAAWPLHAPHRIENLEGFNVSLSVDYQTWESRMLNGAHYTTGLMRRAGLRPPRLAQASKAARAGLWGASLALKRLPLAKDRIAHLERSFALGDQTA